MKKILQANTYIPDFCISLITGTNENALNIPSIQTATSTNHTDLKKNKLFNNNATKFVKIIDTLFDLQFIPNISNCRKKLKRTY